MCSGLNIFDQVVSGCSNIAIFQPAQYDLSLTFLRMIFGSVGGALYGMSNPLVGTIFRIFNTGVLLITSTLIAYAVFLTVIGGSQDGSPMGGNSKGMLNPWVVARIVGGASLLIPSFSGYSAMQVLVMYTVVQGVGFADTVWTASLDYIAATGNSVVSTQVDNNTSNLTVLSNIDGMMDNFYRSSLCMMDNVAVNTAVCTNTPSSCTVAYTQSAGYNDIFVTFPFSCGTYTLSVSTVVATGTESGSSVNQKYSSMLQSGLQQSISILQSAAQASMQSATSILLSYPNEPYSSASTTLNTVACTPLYCSAASAYASAASSYLEVVNYIYQVLHPPANLAENTSWTTSASNRGWISAGMYYFDLAQNYSSGTGAYSSVTPASGPKLTTTGAYIATGSPPASPGVPSGASMTYPMQVHDAYYFNYQQTVCSANCSEIPLAPCNACQAVGLIDNMEASQTAITGGGDAATTEADKLYTGLVFQVFSMMKEIDTYNYCHLLPTGIANGWDALDQCTMVMPVARFNRLVLGGALRVIMGLNPGWWNTAKDSSGLSCSSSWNGSLLDTVSDVITNNGGSNEKSCSTVASNCLSKSDKLTYCGYSKLYPACIKGMYGFFPFLYSAASGGYMDPVYSSSQMGIQLMAISVNYWMTVTKDVFEAVMDASWALFGASAPLQIFADVAAASMNGLVPVAGGLIYALMQVAVNIMKMFFEMSKAVLEMYLPLGASLTAVVFGLGTMLGIYMPFMPFMLYLFGVIGWIMAVIEAMVAAPLVALGITHPEGHDLLGKSEQAVMLLLGVFIRPVTMIMGLLFAMNLAQVAVQLLNYGFLFVFTDIGSMSGDTGSAMTDAYIILGAMVVYAYVLMTIIDQAYSLIYQVPDKILRWIGGPQDTSSTAQMVNQVKGQVQQLGSKGGEAGSSTAGHAPSVGGTTASGSKFGMKDEKDKGNTNTGQASGGVSSSEPS